MIRNGKVINSLFQQCLRTPAKHQIALIHNRERIGNRDWVGNGINGMAVYLDDPAFPFPAIRFKENTNELFALREKEKGDWRKLSMEEKKILYRASFCRTFAESEAFTGIWKSTLGMVLIGLSISMWAYMFQSFVILNPLPCSFDEDFRRANLRRALDYRMGHLTGLATVWDYEKDEWK